MQIKAYFYTYQVDYKEETKYKSILKQNIAN